MASACEPARPAREAIVGDRGELREARLDTVHDVVPALLRRAGLSRELLRAGATPRLHHVPGHFDVTLESNVLAQNKGLFRIEGVGQRAGSAGRQPEDLVVPLEGREPFACA